MRVQTVGVAPDIAAPVATLETHMHGIRGRQVMLRPHVLPYWLRALGIRSESRVLAASAVFDRVPWPGQVNTCRCTCGSRSLICVTTARSNPSQSPWRCSSALDVLPSLIGTSECAPEPHTPVQSWTGSLPPQRTFLSQPVTAQQQLQHSAGVPQPIASSGASVCWTASSPCFGRPFASYAQPTALCGAHVRGSVAVLALQSSAASVTAVPALCATGAQLVRGYAKSKKHSAPSRRHPCIDWFLK